MRYPQEHKSETRERILEAAATVFKERGFGGSGVGAVMKAAGLTHGGFYAHFENKADLIRATLEAAFAHAASTWESRLEGLSGREWLETWVRIYLSVEHVQSVCEGCPGPPLLAEVSRGTKEQRDLFTGVLDGWARSIARHLPQRPSSHQDALSLISMSIGAITLARATDATLAEQVIEATRNAALERIRRLTEFPATADDNDGDGS